MCNCLQYKVHLAIVYLLITLPKNKHVVRQGLVSDRHSADDSGVVILIFGLRQHSRPALPRSLKTRGSYPCLSLTFSTFTITTHDKATFLYKKNFNTVQLLAFQQRITIFCNLSRTTRSCLHKALLSRRGPDTIEKYLQGQRPG